MSQLSKFWPFVVLLLGVSLAGCAAGSPDPSGPKIPQSCADYAALSAKDRGAVADRVIKGGEHVPSYQSTGVVMASKTDQLDSACAANRDMSPDQAVFLGGSDGGAECGAFLKLSESVKSEWLAALVKDSEYPAGVSLTPEQMSETCNSLDADTDGLIRATLWFLDYPHSISWSSETKLGYKAALGLGVGALITGEAKSYPANSAGGSTATQPIMGASCGYDPATDAMIPVVLTARNTTSKEAPATQGAFGLDLADQLVTTVKIESLNADGPNCTATTPQGGYSAGYSGVQWSTPTKPGQADKALSVIVLKNYFSPRFPAGATAELKQYVLVGATVGGGDDPVVTSTTARIHLDGSPAN